jgi:phosphate transport system protein
MSNDHIIKSYDEELGRLRRAVLEMGGIAESQLAAAIEAVTRRDSDLAADVVRNDSALDTLERDIDAAVVRLIALRQPMARDLREIVTALRIATHLERIGDYAANIAKRSIVLNQSPPVKPIFALPRMAGLAGAQIKDVMSAFAAQDAERALAVWSRDDELDDLYSSLFRELLTYMMEDPRGITAGTHLLFMARNIERIGDHVANIAESIYYLVHARTLPGQWPPAGVPGEAQAPTPTPDESSGRGDTDA